MTEELSGRAPRERGLRQNAVEPPSKTLAQPPVGHAPSNPAGGTSSRVGGRPRAVFDVAQAVALYKEGLGVERIAARLSVGGQYVSATTVWRRLRELSDRYAAIRGC